MLLPDPEPREAPFLLISADDHLIEPANLFEGRMPEKLADRAPRIIEHEGAPAWLLENAVLPNFGLQAVAGRPAEEWNDEPRDWDEMRKGCWQIDARIADMDLNGVYASVCFPSRVAGFGGVRFAEVRDHELGLACVRAWNDWHIEEWARPYPERIIPLQVPWLNDPVIGAAEIRKNAERGFKTVTFVPDPPAIGLPPVWSDYWNPFFAACEETQTVVSLHIGASGLGLTKLELSELDTTRPVAIGTASTAVYGITTAAAWLYGGVFTRFPRLKATLPESGVSWVPAMLDRLNYMDGHAGQAYRGAWTDPDLRPAEVLLRNCWFCAFDDFAGIELRHRVGVENILLEVDYPHADGTWPDSQFHTGRLLDGLPQDEILKITHQNAAGLFRHPLPPGYN
jgi:predicted TIM-barrel fold metal-dependent hydrolase